MVIAEDSANLRLLETDPQLLKERAAIPPSPSEIIYLYRNSILDFESKKSALKSELIILQTSLSDIKVALENVGGDGFVLINDNHTSQFVLERSNAINNIYTKISAKLFKLLQEKNIQEKNLQSFLAQTPSNTILAGQIKSGQVNPNIIKFALIGFMLGMILSLILVLIIGIYKAYKEENAITL